MRPATPLAAAGLSVLLLASVAYAHPAEHSPASALPPPTAAGADGTREGEPLPDELVPLEHDGPPAVATPESVAPEGGAAEGGAPRADAPATSPPGAPATAAPRAAPRPRPSAPKRPATRMVPPKGDPACEFRTPLHHHVVEPGEHLGLIAGRYGVRSKDVLALNPELRNPNLLRAGQRVRVCPELPPRERVEDSYVVQPGDTLSEIAERHDLAVAEVLAFNPALGADPNRVRAGQVLRFERDGEVLPAFRPIEVATGGVMTHAQRLPAGEGYLIKRAHNVWGTPRTIELLQRALATYRRAAAAAGPAVRIGDISRRGGGEFPPHLSHRDGRDVDVGYVLKGSAAHVERFVPARRDTLDVARSWRLIEAFLATGEVQMIFVDYGLQALLYEHARKQGMAESELDELFQYPRGKGRGHGIIRHWRSHDGHFHVRFRE